MIQKLKKKEKRGNEPAIDSTNLILAMEELEKESGIVYDKIQRNAIKRAINNNLTIITGGPGTGKTTIVKAIVTLFQKVLKVKPVSLMLINIIPIAKNTLL